MSTISSERVEELRAMFCPSANKDVYLALGELLALRKERERAEPVVVPDCFLNAVSALDSLYRNGQKQCWHERYTTDMAYASGVLNACRAAMLQSGNDEIGSWRNHKNAPTDKPKSEMSQQAEQLLRDTTALAVTLSVETDTTAQQFESLAGKAVVTDENGNLPCPFCGGRCDPNGWMGSYDDGVPMCGPECEDCGATANSIEEWNRRSTALAGKAVVPEGWKLVPVELTKEMRGKIHPFAEATCLNCGRQVVADCEDNVTASWNDMLAVAPSLSGKQSSTADVNNDGFECTPVADLYELLTKCGECYDYTTSAKVASDWIKEGYSAREYVKLDRLQEAMTQDSPGEADGWIPCSERMPVEKDIVLVVDDGYFVCEAQYREGDFFSAVRGNNEFFETTCRDVEFWQPLPEPPCK